ncbi:MAG: tRNA lysidine(34) synthetase TilS [Marinospirillum sp.]|uniref:tRNA lysidine(34) synthetase TilS n=1 Tax=Marinospirillum sp. TaxID=2183934 RepID=UPI0019E80331|nr:tRNA lysidine(34) synthetase TilS [Marinospirillum sp.]MBE0505317.1 tRNA lysidine(34) synthetase TilS [Marinospirillum sp.]
MSSLLGHLQCALGPDTRRICVAFSGGMDSRVLLELTRQLQWAQPLKKQHPQLQIRALHIHHQLSPHADQWAAFCQEVCDAAGIPLSIQCVNPNQWPGASLEDRARKARYSVFEQQLQPDELLLQAHHQDDQAETLLLRLLRGAGTLGLSSIPKQRPLGQGLLLRPLLDIPRAELLAFATAEKLQWIEDESNQQTHFDRNFLRLQVLPLLQQRFPAVSQNLARVTQHATESQQLNRELAELDLQPCRNTETSLSIPPLMALSSHRRFNLLRHWLLLRGLTLPGHTLWEQLDKLCLARKDANPLVSWGESTQRIEARRFQQQLFIAPEEYFQPLPANWQQDWDGKMPIQTPVGLINFRLLASDSLPTASLTFTLRARQGGETLRQKNRGQRDVKRLLQELHLPPWERQRLVFIWLQKELIAVGSKLVAAGWTIEY